MFNPHLPEYTRLHPMRCLLLYNAMVEFIFSQNIPHHPIKTKWFTVTMGKQKGQSYICMLPSIASIIFFVLLSSKNNQHISKSIQLASKGIQADGLRCYLVVFIVVLLLSTIAVFLCFQSVILYLQPEPKHNIYSSLRSLPNRTYFFQE